MRIIKHYWMSIVWAIIIFILCSMPTSDVPSYKLFEIPHFDKFVHFTLYLVLGILLFWESRSNRISNGMKYIVILVVGAICICYGCFIELFQHLFAPWRSADGLDVVANIIGFIVSVIIYPKVEKGAHFFIAKKRV